MINNDSEMLGVLTIKKLLSSFTFILSLTASQSQIDYKDVESQFIRYCGKPDSTTLFHNVAFVDSVTQLNIENNLKLFLEDYGRAYYGKYLYTKNRNDLIIAINAHTRCWERFQDTDALYEMVMLYAIFDCFVSKKYIPLLEERIKNGKLEFKENSESMMEQIKIVKEHVCPN